MRTWGQPSVSQRVADGASIERFIGYRLDCEACYRPFRCFREREARCGCCRTKPVPEDA